MGGDTCPQQCVQRRFSLSFCLLCSSSSCLQAMGRGRPALPPGHDKQSRRKAVKRASVERQLGRKVQGRARNTMACKTYRQKRVFEVMSSQDSCASTVSTGDSSQSSSGLSHRSLRRGASSCLNAIKHLGYKGQRKLFQRGHSPGVSANLDKFGHAICEFW